MNLSLRTRLGLLVLLFSVPVFAGLALLQKSAQQRTLANELSALLDSHIDADSQAACEANPADWSRELFRPHRGARGGREPFEHRIMVYDAEGHGFHGRAPDLSALSMRHADRRGLATFEIDDGPRNGRAFVVPAPWESSICTYMAVVRPEMPNALRTQPLRLALWSALAGALLAWLAGGLIVRRVRRLERAVDAGDEQTAKLVGGGDEVTQLAVALDARRARIVAQLAALGDRDQAIREHIINTSHDLLTPLTVLQGTLRTLAHGDDRERAAAFTLASDQCDFIGALVDNLNATARLTAGNAVDSFVQVDLCGVVERVAARYQTVAERRGAALNHSVPSAPVMLAGDVVLLEQAVGNLVQNAILYGGNGVQIAIVLQADASVVVLDDGPGISPTELDRVVLRGVRGSMAQESGAGSGLGLDIVRSVAELHGYSVELRATDPTALTGLTVELRAPSA